MPDAAPLYPARRQHIDALTTEIGIMQHARGERPDPAHGYCTDDVARALLVDLLQRHELGWTAVRASAARHVTFLAEALEAPGRFRNFRSADGTWLDVATSEDANARALHALGEAMASAPPGGVRAMANAVFARALPTASRVHSIRPLASVVLACDAVVRSGSGDQVMPVYARAARELMGRFESRRGDRDWPWPEPVLTYENELPARALIRCGQRFDDAHMTRTGLAILDWLIDVQTTREGHLSTIGNAGWWPRGGQRARFGQQPISATSLLLAAGDALEATATSRYGDAMEMAYGWFLGRNDIGQRVAEPETGACRDGIEQDGASLNRGAESTLMWHMALERIRDLRTVRPRATAG